jgi:hypothetical protein
LTTGDAITIASRLLEQEELPYPPCSPYAILEKREKMPEPDLFVGDVWVVIFLRQTPDNIIVCPSEYIVYVDNATGKASLADMV